MSTTTAISSNPTRNDGGSILNGGNNNGENVANTPTLLSNAQTNTLATINLQLVALDEFRRGSVTSTWGSGLPADSDWGILNLSGVSGLDSVTPTTAQGDELLFLNRGVTNRYKVKTVFEWGTVANDIPGSPGFVMRINPSGFLHAYNRQDPLGQGRLSVIAYTWNDVYTAVASGNLTTTAANLANRQTNRDLAELEMTVEGSGVTFIINSISIAGDIARQITDLGGFIGVRQISSGNTDYMYHNFELHIDTQGNNSIQKSISTNLIDNNNNTILHANKTIRNHLGTPRNINYNHNIRTIQKGGQLDVPITKFPDLDIPKHDVFGSGEVLTRANQSSYRANVGAKAPTQFNYDAKN